MTNNDELRKRAALLGLHGMVERWSEYVGEPWLEPLLKIEEEARDQRSLERRIKNSKVGSFKTLADFDWKWPTKIDQTLVKEAMTLDFLEDAGNLILVGPNGVGKTTIAQNVGYAALLAGHTVLRMRASEMLSDLARQETATSLTRRLRKYCNPTLLVVDELGYLSFDSRAGDLFFEVVSRRHEKKSIVLTTNRPFAEWNEIFTGSSCVTALIDRLVHRAQILKIEGESYRAKEAQERMNKKAQQRKEKNKKKKKQKGEQEK